MSPTRLYNGDICFDLVRLRREGVGVWMEHLTTVVTINCLCHDPSFTEVFILYFPSLRSVVHTLYDHDLSRDL